jgi:hypothetical protein
MGILAALYLQSSVVIGEAFDRQIGANPELYSAWYDFLCDYFLKNPEVMSVWLELLPVEEAVHWAVQRLSWRLVSSAESPDILQ